MDLAPGRLKPSVGLQAQGSRGAQHRLAAAAAPLLAPPGSGSAASKPVQGDAVKGHSNVALPLHQPGFHYFDGLWKLQQAEFSRRL